MSAGIGQRFVLKWLYLVPRRGNRIDPSFKKKRAADGARHTQFTNLVRNAQILASRCRIVVKNSE